MISARLKWKIKHHRERMIYAYRKGFYRSITRAMVTEPLNFYPPITSIASGYLDREDIVDRLKQNSMTHWAKWPTQKRTPPG